MSQFVDAVQEIICFGKCYYTKYAILSDLFFVYAKWNEPALKSIQNWSLL